MSERIIRRNEERGIDVDFSDDDKVAMINMTISALF